MVLRNIWSKKDLWAKLQMSGLDQDVLYEQGRQIELARKNYGKSQRPRYPNTEGAHAKEDYPRQAPTSKEPYGL